MGSYQVQSGDNLWKIVKNTFKLTDSNQINKKVQEIVTLNKIKNANSVFVGQKLDLGQTAQEDNKPLPLTATKTYNLVNSSNEFNPTPEQLSQSTKKKPIPLVAANQEPPQCNPSEIAPINWKGVTKDFIPEALKPQTETVKPPLAQQETIAKQDATEKPNTPVTAQNNKPAAPSQTAPSPVAQPAEKPTGEQTEKPADFVFLTETFIPDSLKNKPTQDMPIVPFREGINPQDAIKKQEPPAVKQRKLSLAQYAKIPVITEFSGTADDINKHLGGVLKGQGDKFIELQEKYGINAAFLAGIVMNESSNGTSKLALKKNNVGGVRYPNSKTFKKYDDVGDCLEHMAKFLSEKYVQQGRTTIGLIGEKYCPVTDETDTENLNQYWYRNVGYNMAKIDPRNTTLV